MQHFDGILYVFFYITYVPNHNRFISKVEVLRLEF